MRYVLFPFTLFAILLLSVWAGDGFFTQKCRKAFPNLSYVDHERCIHFLSKGGKVWEFPPPKPTEFSAN